MKDNSDSELVYKGIVRGTRWGLSGFLLQILMSPRRSSCEELWPQKNMKRFENPFGLLEQDLCSRVLSVGEYT